MAKLNDFTAAIESKLASANERVRQERAGLSERMDQFEKAKEGFDKLSARVMNETIRPRMQQLAARFEHAEMTSASPEQCSCHFAHTIEFPATADICFQVQHNQGFKQLSLEFCSQILPDLIPHERHCSTCVSHDLIEEQQLAAWVEERLLSFLDAYLQVQVLDQFQTLNRATDPVCKMQVTKGIALSAEHEGQTYYFCADKCLREFEASPSRYL